jgi:glycosyltransferase involved in cell wall biosynthesis
MNGRSGDVSIIVPTRACYERARSLVRAIDSAVAQQGARGIPLVVVNGGVGAPDVLDLLRRRTDIRLVMLEEANLPNALRAGRALVDTPFFAVLDDDDELLPGALRTRLEALETAAGADVVVTSGFLEGFGRRDVNIADFGRIEADPLRMLLVQHWLPPGAGFFRTTAVTADFFAAIPRYREWTYLALRLALALRIHFVNRPTFVYRTDTPGSLSKSRAYGLAGAAAISRMLELDLPADVRATLRTRLAGDRHSASVYELDGGRHGAAWRWHVKSLTHPSGWRYLPFTRRLLVASLSGLAGSGRTPPPGST